MTSDEGQSNPTWKQYLVGAPCCVRCLCIQCIQDPSLCAQHEAILHDDLFSLAWDIVIPCGVALLATLLLFQQWFGGAFFLCSKRRKPWANTKWFPPSALSKFLQLYSLRDKWKKGRGLHIVCEIIFSVSWWMSIYPTFVLVCGENLYMHVYGRRQTYQTRFGSWFTVPIPKPSFVSWFTFPVILVFSLG